MDLPVGLPVCPGSDSLHVGLLVYLGSLPVVLPVCMGSLPVDPDIRRDRAFPAFLTFLVVPVGQVHPADSTLFYCIYFYY